VVDILFYAVENMIKKINVKEQRY